MSAQADILDAVATWLDGEMSIPVEYPSLPRSADDAMPFKTLVVTPGGNAGSAGDRSYIPVARLRADLRCYGETEYQAMRVYREAAALLKGLKRQTVTCGPTGEEVGVVLDNAILSAGPLALTDPDTKWPFVYATWGVHGSEIEVVIP
jgi:hypothetical protein